LVEEGSAIRSDGTVAAAGVRYSPVTVAGRIARIEDDLRWVHRRLTGADRTVFGSDGTPSVITVPPARGPYRALLIEQRSRLLGRLRHWRRVREWQIAAGRVREHGPATITPGDAVRVRGRWHRVVRTRLRTVMIERDGGPPKAVAYRMIQDHSQGVADASGAAPR